MVAGRMVTVGTTAVDLISGLTFHEYEIVVRVPATLGVDVFLGDSAVSATDGFQISRTAGDIYRFTLRGEHLYAITNGGSGTITVLAYEV